MIEEEEYIWPTNKYTTYSKWQDKPRNGVRRRKNYPQTNKILGHEKAQQFFDGHTSRGVFSGRIKRHQPEQGEYGWHSYKARHDRNQMASWLIRFSGSQGLQAHSMEKITGWALHTCQTALREACNWGVKRWEYKYQFYDKVEGKWFDERGLQ